MKHTIRLTKDDVVEIKYVGDISEEDNLEMIKQSYQLIAQLVDKGHRPLVLVDLTETEQFNPPQINVQAMRDSDAFKMAGFGISNPDDLKTAEAIIEKAGSKDHVKIFGTREQALSWLKE